MPNTPGPSTRSTLEVLISFKIYVSGTVGYTSSSGSTLLNSYVFSFGYTQFSVYFLRKFKDIVLYPGFLSIADKNSGRITVKFSRRVAVCFSVAAAVSKYHFPMTLLEFIGSPSKMNKIFDILDILLGEKKTRCNE